jgi:AraC-like DNA-binding protein
MSGGQILGQNGQRASALGSVSAAYAQALLDTAIASGAERKLLMSRAGIAAEQLRDPGWRLPLAGLLRLFDHARELSGDDLIGLHMGMQVRPRTFSALGYAAMSCSTLGEAVALIPRYESLVYDGGITQISLAGKLARVSWQSGMQDHARMRPVNEAIVAGWLSFGRWISGIRGELREACFQHPRPLALTEYERFFGCPLRFDAADNALSFEVTLLATPLIQHDDQLRGLMEQQAREQLRQIQGTQLTPRVIAAIRRCLPQRAPAAAEIARALGLSERSLRRHLHTEGSSFGDLVIRLRHELALHYLAEPDLGLAEIALLLGYSELSSFTAAFKSWTGVPPREYRQRHSTP